MNVERLKRLREKTGLTQSQFGQIFGFSNQRYNYYETGKREPDNETLRLFAEYFKVSTDYLLGKDDDAGNLVSAEKSDAEILGIAIKQALIRAGKLNPNEPITQELKESLIRIIGELATF